MKALLGIPRSAFLFSIVTSNTLLLRTHLTTELKTIRERNKSIPVNIMADKFDTGVFIGRASATELHLYDEVKQPHRDDYHLFCLQEEGSTSFEIDFQKYKIDGPAVIYISPNQVHNVVAVEDATISIWVINNENLNPAYLALLEDLSPTKPLALNEDVFSIISETISLCIKLSERTHEKLYNSLLKDGCNTLIALVASQYLQQSKTSDSLTRFDLVTKSFKSALEKNFLTLKSPTAYAKKLNLSAPYLNECVKHSTGYSVSHHIQQRIVLEAKRLLYHSDKSVKEIANELGYDDYPYFSRLFTKVSGMTAISFRNKNLD